MKKSVLFSVLSLSGGGAERVVSVWANELSQRGWDVSVLVFKRCKDEYPVLPSVRILEVAKTPEEYLGMSFMERFKKIRGLMKQAKPAYMLSFLSTAQFWTAICSMGLKSKRIETVRNNPWRDGGGRLSRMVRNICYRTGWKIVVQSRDQAPFFSKGVQKKCALIPNPISEIYVNAFRQDTADEAVNFIAAGRLTPQKNYPMMIRAFAMAAQERPELQLRIFGAGSEAYEKDLKALIVELGMENNIRLMGRSAQIDEEYRTSDAFLMSSDYEGLPNALAEAMASRLICISTDCKTGPKDLIDHGMNGYLAPTGDTEAFAGCIRQVCAMTREDRAAMADRAREKILTYCSEDNSVSRLCEILK